MSVLLVGCKKSEDNIEPPVNHPLTKLKFSPEKTIIEQGKTTEVTIVGTLKSTDKVKVINEEIVTLQEAVTNNKIKLLAKRLVPLRYKSSLRKERKEVPLRLL